MKRYTCAECGFATNSRKVISGHMFTEHPGPAAPELAACTKCGRVYIIALDCYHCTERK